MHWKLKAALQNTIACLPSSLSYAAYYRVQRVAGGLRRVNPTKRLRAGVETWRHLLAAGADPTGGVFFEVGTGRTISVPVALWLMGAERTVTVDLNPYLKGELIHAELRYLAENRDSVAELFNELLIEDRYQQLLRVAEADRFDLDAYLDLVGVEYRAPLDATATGLPDGCIDFHTSYTVMEHIPPAVLAGILQEAKRLLGPGGLAVHGIDYSDHFSHSDARITAVNFLRYSPRVWNRWAGNRYMYMNRMRHPEYLQAFLDNGLGPVADETVIDQRSLEALRAGKVVPDSQYAEYSAEQLATTSSWIVAAPQTEPAQAVA